MPIEKAIGVGRIRVLVIVDVIEAQHIVDREVQDFLLIDQIRPIETEVVERAGLFGHEFGRIRIVIRSP